MRDYNEAQAIRNLQTYLRRLSYTDPSIPPPPIDGVFDEETRNALKAFQGSEGLPATGRADRITWDRLYAKYLQEAAKVAPPKALNVFPRLPDGYILKAGDRYYLVGIVQLLLNELSADYGFSIPLSITEEIDEETAERIREFQRRNLLADTGEVDLTTWDRLADQFHRHATDYVR